MPWSLTWMCLSSLCQACWSLVCHAMCRHCAVNCGQRLIRSYRASKKWSENLAPKVLRKPGFDARTKVLYFFPRAMIKYASWCYSMWQIKFLISYHMFRVIFGLKFDQTCQCIWSFFHRLWLATVNTLCPAETLVPHLTPQLYTDEDIMKDPLTVLRCNRRVFR